MGSFVFNSAVSLKLSSVNISLSGWKPSSRAASSSILTLFRSLAEEKINILAISTSEIKISVLIREELTQKAVKVLHKTFGLN